MFQRHPCACQAAPWYRVQPLGSDQAGFKFLLRQAQAGDLDFSPAPTSFWLHDFGQVTQPLWDSVSSCIEWEL